MVEVFRVEWFFYVALVICQGKLQYLTLFNTMAFMAVVDAHKKVKKN